MARAHNGVPVKPLPSGEVVVAGSEGGESFISRILRKLGGEESGPGESRKTNRPKFER
jgi:hypothetical protein